MGHQRAKIELYDDSLFVVLKTLRYVEATSRRRDRRGHGVPRRPVRRHGAARRGANPLAGVRARPGGRPPSACSLRPDRGAARGHGRGRRQLRSSSTARSTRTSSEIEQRSSPATARQRRAADLPPEARGAGVPPARPLAAALEPALRPAAPGDVAGRAARCCAVLPRRGRPPAQGQRPRRVLRPAAHRHPQRPPGADLGRSRTTTCARSRPGSRSPRSRP